VLQALIVLLLVGTNSVLAVLTPYSSEVYPTRVRARGTGLAGACACGGGLLGVGVVVIGLAPPSLTGAAALGAVPTALAALAVARYGVETRRRRLEEITATELAARTSERRPMDCLVIGAGPAGLQLGYFLDRAGRDYLILEGGPTPGTFFRTFPRHRRLISINKPHTGWDDPELNLRMDWNSLLSDDPRLLFTRYSGRYLPDADDLVRYLADFAYQGEPSWVYVTFRSAPPQGHYDVRLLTRDGRRLALRPFTATPGGTAWGSTIQVPIQQIQRIEFIRSDVPVLTASFG